MLAQRLTPVGLLAACAGFAAAVGVLVPIQPIAAGLIVLVGAVYAWVLVDWRRGVLALLVVLPFAGVPAFLVGSRYALIARDIAIGIPLYGAFLAAMVLKRERFTFTRTRLAFVALLFALVVAVSVFLAPSPSIGLVGAKVWLFYIPMVAIGYQYVQTTDDALRVLKITAALAVIPSALGIVEWFVMSRTGTLGPFSRMYGSLTDKVNGQYVRTSEIRFSRIPSTFTSVSQYVSFCYVGLTAALAVALVRRSARWIAVVGVVGLAAMTSGARAALLSAPLLIWLGVLWSGFRLSRAALVVLTTGAIVGGLAATGADLHAYRHELSSVAAVDGTHAVDEFSHSLHKIVGDGTGSHTNAALRYGSGDVDQMVENWYARAGAELGVVGLALAAGLLLSAMSVVRNACRQLSSVSREIGGPILALAFITLLISFKGSILDIDPFNVYFWMLVGLAMKLPELLSAERDESD
jgi:hypothetical protein